MRRPARLRSRLMLALALFALLPVLAQNLASAPPARADAANPAPVTVPKIGTWTGGHGQLTLPARPRIVLPAGAAGDRLRDTADLLRGELGDELRRDGRDRAADPLVTTGTPQDGDIVLALRDTGQSDEGYRLAIGDTVEIAAPAPTGAFYGTRTLLQALRTAAEPGTLPRGTAVDQPADPVRGQMIDAGRKYFPVSYLKQQIRQMGWLKLNSLHLHLTDWNAFRIDVPGFHGLAAKDSYTPDDIRGLEAYAHRYHVTIVPEIDIPGHAVAISKYRPDLAFSCPSMSSPHIWTGSDTGGWTLDITKPATQDFLAKLLRAVVPLFDGPVFHLGGDEIPQTANQEKCPELVAHQKAMGYGSPSDVFVESIDKLDSVVRSLGKRTEIWQWWDYQQQTTIQPNKDITVLEWLSRPEGRAAQGYPVVGTEEARLYVSPGFGTKPGDYGYVDLRDVYGKYDFTAGNGVTGYRISRWSDNAESQPVPWFDFWARRPLAVVADRTWGAPAGPIGPFLERLNQVGDADPARTDLAANPGMLPRAGWTAGATSEETAAENGAAANAFDGDPYTLWHSAYSSGTPALPQQLSADLGAPRRIAGFRYLPRQDGGVNGRVADYRFLTSNDGKNWHVAAHGTLPDTQEETVVRFPETTAKHIALQVLSEHGPQHAYASAAELDVIRGR